MLQTKSLVGQSAMPPAEELPLWLGQQAPTKNQAQVSTVINVNCNESLHAPSGKCPHHCPFYVAIPGQVCSFKCVEAKQCGDVNPETVIADPTDFMCRKCKVVGCSKCAPGGKDSCAECASGYVLDEATGACHSATAWVKRWLFGIVGFLLMIVLAWYIDLLRRPAVNMQGLAEGLLYRSQQKLRMPLGYTPPGAVTSPRKADGGHGHHYLWPLSTSLHDTMVAGAGLVLHMNYQLSIIAWAAMCVSCWVLYSYMTEVDLLTLGMHDAQTPTELCSMTLTGKTAQHQMMSAKVWFLTLMYAGTLCGQLVYAAYNERRYCDMDDAASTMMDFAVVVTGIPFTPGSERLEEQLKEALVRATGQKVVGVCVGWQYRHKADDVMAALERDAERDSSTKRSVLPIEEQATEAEVAACSHKFGLFNKIDALFGFGPDYVKEDPPDIGDVREMVEGLMSSDTAIAVFETQEASDEAVHQAESRGGIPFGGAKLELRGAPCEPDTMQWEIFSVPSNHLWRRSAYGILTVLLAVGIWGTCFYYPYAYYESSFSAASGDEPGFLSDLTFSMLVVAGNQAMYFLCTEVAYRVGFRFGDNAQAFYIAIYTFACFCNVLVDMGLELWLCYHSMVAANVHIADGRLLSELTSYQEIFESYPMQKFMGNRIFAYAFPSTFIIPFIMEPLFAIALPYHLMALLLRSHAGVRGREAEKSMEFFTPMDMGRYGDLALNVIITSFIFMVPSGRMLPLFLALIICHSYVYFYDKYRVLRCVPEFIFSSSAIEWCAQRLLMFPTGMILIAIIFKGNCLETSPFCVHGDYLVFVCLGAFVLHIVVHSFLLEVVAAWATHATDAETAQDCQSYAEVATNFASNWFTSNPVHCLRSKHFYQHSPPCNFHFHGREYLLHKNPELGCYFERSFEDMIEEALAEETDDEEDTPPVLGILGTGMSFRAASKTSIGASSSFKKENPPTTGGGASSREDAA